MHLNLWLALDYLGDVDCGKDHACKAGYQCVPGGGCRAGLEKQREIDAARASQQKAAARAERRGAHTRPDRA